MFVCAGMRVYPCNVKERARFRNAFNCDMYASYFISLYNYCIEQEFMMIITITWILNLYIAQKFKRIKFSQIDKSLKL